MEGGNPAQPPVVQTTQVQSPPGQPFMSQQQVPSGQPIMYQMQPGQQQPVFVQVPAGQPATTPDGQPIQYYYVPMAQPMHPGQQGQPAQPVQPGRPVQPGQPVYVQQVQSQQQATQGLDLTIDKDFFKSPLCYIKIAEFVVLLGAWASILKYSDDLDDLNTTVVDDKASFFKGITIFCWVMVILYLIIYTLSFPKNCSFKRPSLFTLTSLIFYFIMFALLLACTGNLVSRAVEFGKLQEQFPSNKTVKKFVTTLSVALAFGFLSCIAFVIDMVLNYKLFQTQRAHEMPSDEGPPQRRVLDVNTEYMRSTMFYVKLAEIVLLFAAWVCIVKYFDMPIFKTQSPPEDSAADFFRGITIFAWVMVVLLALAFVLSFDKLCSRSSPWALTSLIFCFIMFALLLACTGNLVSRAVEFGKLLEQSPSNKTVKKYVTTLSVALAFGFLSCIAFAVDMVLNYKLFQTQRAQEMPPDQGPPQRRAWDVNTEYMRSPMFYVKLAEIVLLFAAWVCIIKYFDAPAEDSEADFFRGITIFAWVIVVLLALTFALSFDKLWSRSSPWVLTTLLIHFFLSILLIACCGKMTPLAIDYGKAYKNVYKKYKPNVLALLIGLGFGYISWMIFIVDIYLLYKLYKQQRIEEIGNPQQAGQPGVVQQPTVVIVPQGAKQQVYQPPMLPGQQPTQYPGQQPVLIGMPPPAYS